MYNLNIGWVYSHDGFTTAPDCLQPVPLQPPSSQSIDLLFVLYPAPPPASITLYPTILLNL